MTYDEVTAKLVRENRELRALLTEARAALEPLTEAQIKLHRIKRDLADRIDAALGVTEGLTRLNVTTRHPQDYVLHNEQDGTRWRGTAEGRWVRDGVIASPELVAQERATQIAEAFGDLPDALRAHPGIKRLYRAALGVAPCSDCRTPTYCTNGLGCAKKRADGVPPSGHVHPHPFNEDCHCVVCRPLERPCGCAGCAGHGVGVADDQTKR